MKEKFYKTNFIIWHKILGSKAPTCAKYDHNGDEDLRWMCVWSYKKEGKIRNEIILNKVEVVPAETSCMRHD